jgi:CCT motif
LESNESSEDLSEASEIAKDMDIEPEEEPSILALQRQVGPISFLERAEKIYKFFVKKKQKHLQKKYTYKCRQDVAEKRLRIKGRFVTREQAYEILGLTQNQLKSNEII